ncbi:hypothetical protein [Rhodoligotrophos ferricapiens]|uniref:hypothetical protein n=1 Tax=Rhodoligotrophos ferricapiens TaxID=3069264 RepID=UPI00315DB8BB
MMMWLRGGRPTERELIAHCRGLGIEPPADCRDIDHVPPKDVAAWWVYQTMIAAAPQPPAAQEPVAFQQEVDRWLIACFGETIARDKVERNHRFLEEALELVQSGGCTKSEAHQLVDYVFGRPVGDMSQEVGGVMNTLAALCLSYGLDMDQCGAAEMARVWAKVEQIREKQRNKPKHSPLPQHPAPADDRVREQIRREVLEEVLEALRAKRDHAAKQIEVFKEKLAGRSSPRRRQTASDCIRNARYRHRYYDKAMAVVRALANGGK